MHVNEWRCDVCQKAYDGVGYPTGWLTVGGRMARGEIVNAGDVCSHECLRQWVEAKCQEEKSE